MSSFPETLRAACKPRVDRYTRVWQASFRRSQRFGLDVDVGRYENLREDFLSFLDRHEVPGDALRQAVLRAEPVNSSKRNGYRSYYDDELRDLVGEKARRIVKLYDYSF